MKLRIHNVMVSTLLGCLILLWGAPSVADIVSNWESPLNKQRVSGIGIVSGWAYSTTPNATIAVKIFVDGTDYGEIACCGERGDVAQTHGPQALLSGFGRGVNFSGLSDGEHTLRLEIRDNVAAPTTIERQITVVRVGGFSFLDTLSLLAADANIDGQKVVIRQALAQESGTDASREVTVRLAWRQETQTLAIIDSENTSGTTTTTSSSSSQEQAVAAQRVARAETAADAIRANLENPPALDVLTVGGKGLVSGWAFPVTAGASIMSVYLRVDGANVLTIPCCTIREDVAIGNPDFPQALRSGFATVVNFNELSSKEHTIGVEIRDSTGASLIIERKATVVRLGDQPFLEEFDLSQSGAQIVGGFALFLDKIRIRAPGSAETQEVAARYNWQASCQCFVPQSLCGNGGLEPGEECDGATLGGDSCSTLGFRGGTLACSEFCTFETKDCTGGPSLYVTNVVGDSVSVIDTAKNEVTTTIPVGRSPRGIAISPDGATAYVTSAVDDTVSLVDTTSNTVSMTIPVGKAPQGIMVTPDGTKAYVVNGKGNSVTVLNTATKQVVVTIPVGKEPQAIAIAPDGKTAYVTNFDDNTVSVLNTAADTVLSTVALGSKKGPNGIAVTPDGQRALVVNFNGDSFSLLDATANPVVVSGDPVSFGLQPAKVAISADGTRAYISSVLDSTVGVFDLTKNPVEEAGSVFTSFEPDGVAVFSQGKRLYVAGFGRSGTGRELDVISTVNNGVITTITVGKGPFALALKPPPP